MKIAKRWSCRGRNTRLSVRFVGSDPPFHAREDVLGIALLHAPALTYSYWCGGAFATLSGGTGSLRS